MRLNRNIKISMKYIRPLPDAEELMQTLSITPTQQKDRMQSITELQNILSGKSKRKILCIGPCSADNEKAVLEYMTRLCRLKERVNQKLLIVPRVYTSKPRTNGIGYKGLLHRPSLNKGSDNIYEGILAMRKMHLHIIQETGFFLCR